MRRTFFLWFAPALAIALLPSCTLARHFGEKRRRADAQKTAQTPKAPQLVGTIVLVNTEGAFALIDNGSHPSPTIGTIVHSHPANGTLVELRVTEIRKRPFVIADIIRGTPQKGGEVFQ